MAATGVAAVALAGCSGGASAGDDQTLRIAMGSPGEAQIRVWESVAEQFEAANDGWKVDLNYQDDDQYQTIGLPNLLNGPQRARHVFRVGRQPSARPATPTGSSPTSPPYVEDGPLTGSARRGRSTPPPRSTARS